MLIKSLCAGCLLSKVWRFQLLEDWIVATLATNPNGPFLGRVNTSGIIAGCPETFATNIPDDSAVYSLLFYMENPLGLLMRFQDDSFGLSNNGLLDFRKKMAKLHKVAQDDKLVSKIIDESEGTKDTKNKFKKFLKDSKNELPDEFYEHTIDFLKRLGVEGVFYLVRLLSIQFTSN